MADPVFPKINGFYPSWASIELVCNDKRVLVLKELNYSQKAEKGEVWGTAPQLAGKTRGKLVATADFTLYLPQYMTLIADLGDGYMEKSFNIVVNYAPPAGDLITDEIVGCTIEDAERQAAEGTDPLTVKVTLKPFYILENGIKPISDLQE